MVFLLQSASQIRPLGVLDFVVAILPLVAGLVMLSLNIVDSSNFKYTAYQHNSIAVLIVVSAAEFLLTIWIRFVVNRRTIGLGAGRLYIPAGSSGAQRRHREAAKGCRGDPDIAAWRYRPLDCFAPLAMTA